MSHQKGKMGKDRRLLLAGLAGLLGLAGWAHWAGVFRSATAAEPTVVGVFFPGNSESNWQSFVSAAQEIAKDRDYPVQPSASPNDLRMQLPTGTVLFRWFTDLGTHKVQHRVAELCQQANPPVAVVGSSNSSLTNALAEQLAKEAKRRGQAPLLLMTVATENDLLNVHRGNSFRIGFNNNYQAAATLRRLREWFSEKGMNPREICTVVVPVLDDPYSVDLADAFTRQLRDGFDKIVFPERDEGAWRLRTSTGSYSEPSEEERKLAKELVDQAFARHTSEWVLVFPFGTGVYRRMTLAMHQAIDEHPNSAIADEVRSRLIILSGDALSYYTFQDSEQNGLYPERTPAPVIFFSHVNPIDHSVSTTPSRSIPSIALNRDMIAALLTSMQSVGRRASPVELASALDEYVEPGAADPFFKDRERRAGGGAVVAVPVPVPSPEDGKFSLFLPSHWTDPNSSITGNK